MSRRAINAFLVAAYLSALLNASALVLLLISSERFSSPQIHQTFMGSVAWFFIGVLLSGAAVVFFHFHRLLYGDQGRDDAVTTITPVSSAMSLLMLVLGIWESIPLTRITG